MSRTVTSDGEEKERRRPARRWPSMSASPAPQGKPAQGRAAEAVAYEQFLELTTDGIWRYDVVPSVSTKLPARDQAEAILARARLGFCNRAFANLYGFERADALIGTPLSSLLEGTDEEKIRFVADSVGTGYRFVSVEAANRDRDGRAVWTVNNVAGIVKRGRLVGGWGTSHDITDRKLAETALREAHADLHATLAAFPDMVFEIDGEGRIRAYHAPEPDQLYAAPAAFLGQRVTEVLPPDAAEIILSALGGAVRDGAHRGAKYSLPYSSGRRWFDLSIAAKSADRGPDARYIAIARDITAQEAVSDALRASEQQLALALDATSDGIYDADLVTGVTHYNARYATMLGYAPAELPPSQETWERLLHPEDRVGALQSLDDCLRGKTNEYEMEFRLGTKSGEWRWILSRGRVVARGGKGEALRLVGTHRDVTARRETRDALRQERDLAQLYLDTAEIMLVALDREGAIRLINRKGCAVLGWETPAQLVGRNWFACCVPSSAAAATEQVFRKLIGGEVEAVEYYENPVLTTTGSERLIAWHNALLRDAEGRITGTLSSGEDITARRRAEQTLGQTLALLARSEEISHVGSWELDRVTGQLVWSDEVYRIFGLEPQEFVATYEAFLNAVHPEDRGNVDAAYSDSLREGKDSYEISHRVVRPRTGEIRHVREKCVHVRDTAGAVVRSVGMAQDVTEQTLAEATQRASEEKYRLLVENASEAVFVAQDGVLKFANPATGRILGRTANEMRDQSFAELVHPDDRAMVISRHRRRLAGESNVELGYAFRVLRADGSPRWVEISAVRIEWEGRPATLNFASDITARRAAEEAQRESEERFRRIFEESPIGMVTAGLDFRFTRANGTFCRMIGYTERELLNKSFVDITHPEHVDIDVESVKRVARGETPSYRTEKRYVRKDGGVVWGALTVTAMRDAEGQAQYFLSMIEDVTARRESEAARAESERKYRELADDLPTCVFEAGLDGRVTYANRTGLEWFGYAEEEIVGHRNINDMVAADERERAVRTFRRAVEDGEIPAGEYTAVRRDGSTFPALVSSRAIVRDGQTIGVRGILIDITERVEAARRVERALAGTIHALAVTTEMRDPYTAGHQERVTRLAVAIGRKMELPEIRLEGLRVAGLLHDVGKVSVPAEILSKPTELTPIEFALVRSHPETGYAILREIDFPWPVAAIVLQHHERMDGSGYPSGLRGEEIFLEARILAVADTVEAMASHRPYRAAFGIAEALAELARGTGSTFDAAVASACQELFAEGEFQWDA